MNEVASAYVGLVPSAQGFGRKLDGQISGDVTKSGKKSGVTWGKVFAIGAGLAVGRKAISFLGDSLAEAREAEKVGNRTTNVIKSMGLQSKVTAGEVGDLANQISLKTGIDDEAIQSTENLLLGFKDLASTAGDLNGNFAQATGLATDMAVALDKSAKSGAIQLGRALQDPIKGMTALTRVGVSFTEGQQKQITKLVESGKSLKAQGIILAEVKKKFGGAAEAMASPADKARVAFDNLKEQIGTALLPIVDRFLTFITNTVIPGISEFAGTVKRKFNEAKEPVKNFFDAVKNSDTFKSIVGGIADAAGRLKRGFEGAKDALAGMDFSKLDSAAVGEFLGEAIADGLTAIIGLAKDVTKKLGEMFAKVDWVGLGIALGQQVPALLVGLAAGFLTFDIAGLFKQMADHWQVILGAVLVIAFAPAKFATILGKILSKIPFVGTFLARAVIWLNQIGGKVTTFGADILRAFWRGLTAGRTPGAAIVAKIMAGFRGLPGAVRGFFDTLRIRLGVYALEGAQAFGAGVRAGFGIVVKFLAGVPGKILSAIGNLAQLLFPKGTAVIAGMAKGITERIVGVFTTLRSIPAKILAAVGDLSNLLYSKGVSLVTGFGRGMLSKLQSIYDAGKAIASKIAGLFPGSPIKEGPLKGWNNGGAGKRLMELLAKGVALGSKAVEKAMDGVLDKLKSKLDAKKGVLAGLLDKASSLSESVGSAFTSGLFDISATDAVAEVRDELGNITTEAVPGKSAGQNFIESLMGSKSELSGLLTAFKTLKAAGFSAGFLSQLFASGNGALIMDLAADPSLASQAQVLFSDVTDLSSELGAAVSGNQFGDKIDGVREEIKILQTVIKDSGSQNAREFAAALNAAAADASRGHGGNHKRRRGWQSSWA